VQSARLGISHVRLQCTLIETKVRRGVPASAAAKEQGIDGTQEMSGRSTHDLLEMGPMSWPSRSCFCGDVSEENVDQEVTLCGWVDGYRNFGGVLFLDIRDHTGLVQVYFRKYFLAQRLRISSMAPLIGCFRSGFEK